MRSAPFARPTLTAAVELLEQHSQARFNQVVLRPRRGDLLQVERTLRISPVIMRRRAAYRRLRCVAARGSDGRRPRKSPLHRLDPVHVGCKKLAPALASMDDKRMLHPSRALAPDLK
jgi:hypothetical protein